MSQGTILRPLFFVLVMDEFSDTSKLHFRFLFTDDKSVFLEGIEYLELTETVNAEINTVIILLNAKKNDCKNEKTQSMLFRKSKIKIIVKT